MLFVLPTRAAGNGFIEEMAKLVNSWTYKSDLETIALKALMIRPSLLLQKASSNSKSKENSETLKRRLSLWKNGQLDQLMFEGKIIQDRPQNIDRVTTKKKKKRGVNLCTAYQKRKGQSSNKNLGKNQQGRNSST